MRTPCECCCCAHIVSERALGGCGHSFDWGWAASNQAVFITRKPVDSQLGTGVNTLRVLYARHDEASNRRLLEKEGGGASD